MWWAVITNEPSDFVQIPYLTQVKCFFLSFMSVVILTHSININYILWQGAEVSPPFFPTRGKPALSPAGPFAAAAPWVWGEEASPGRALGPRCQALCRDACPCQLSVPGSHSPVTSPGRAVPSRGSCPHSCCCYSQGWKGSALHCHQARWILATCTAVQIDSSHFLKVMFFIW